MNDLKNNVQDKLLTQVGLIYEICFHQLSHLIKFKNIVVRLGFVFIRLLLFLLLFNDVLISYLSSIVECGNVLVLR